MLAWGPELQRKAGKKFLRFKPQAAIATKFAIFYSRITMYKKLNLPKCWYLVCGLLRFSVKLYV